MVNVSPTTIPLCCPSPIAVMHSLYEQSWERYNALEMQELDAHQKGQKVRGFAGPMASLSLAEERLSLAILTSTPTTIEDLAIVAVHLSVTAELLVDRVDGADDLHGGVETGLENVIAFLAKQGVAMPSTGVGGTAVKYAVERARARNGAVTAA